MRRLSHILRLIGIARTLARHDALFPLEPLPGGPSAARLLGLTVRRSNRNAERRPGQRLADALQDLGPSFIKLGQALSVRADLLGETMANDLGQLRDKLPPFPSDVAKRTIESELGQPIAELFVDFEDRPVAAASIAQVHRAVTQAADPEVADTSEGRRAVAVKVLRPGIETAFRRDIELFRWLAAIAEDRVPALRRLRPVEVVETLRDAVEIEMDLALEAAAASELKQNLAAVDHYRIPAVDWQRTGRRILTQDWVDGIAIDDRDGLITAGHEPAALARQVIEVFLAQALRDGFFHADPHHGNLFVDEQGRLVAVDFGIMGRLDRPTRLFMAEMLAAFLAGDYRRAAEVHFEAGYVPADKSVAAFAQACRSIGEPILGKPVSEISIGTLLAQLFRITKTFDMQTQPQLLLLQKTMVTVEGVARGLDPEINFWQAAEPVIADWRRTDLGIDAQLQELGRETAQLARRLPRLIGKLERMADNAAAIPNSTGDRQRDRRLSWPWTVAIAAAAVALVLAVN